MRADSRAARSVCAIHDGECVAPARASSTEIARAAPPAPRITIGGPAAGRMVATDSRKPLPSVLSPEELAVPDSHAVDRADGLRGRAEAVEMFDNGDLVRDRAVESLPLHRAAPRTAARQVFRPDLHRQIPPASPSAANAGSIMACVGFSATGNPKTPVSSCLKDGGAGMMYFRNGTSTWYSVVRNSKNSLLSHSRLEQGRRALRHALERPKDGVIRNRLGAAGRLAVLEPFRTDSALRSHRNLPALKKRPIAPRWRTSMDNRAGRRTAPDPRRQCKIWETPVGRASEIPFFGTERIANIGPTVPIARNVKFRRPCLASWILAFEAPEAIRMKSVGGSEAKTDPPGQAINGPTVCRWCIRPRVARVARGRFLSP